MDNSGAYYAEKKDGTPYYRASITYKDKHISLGSFDTEEAASSAYHLATDILRGEKNYQPDDYEKISQDEKISFEKWIMLLNLKKTGIYCKNPILLYGKFFIYYIDRNTELKFDADDLFFYMNHKIQKRGGHLFYSDYGMQCNVLNRYGIKSFAVKGRDYAFKNGDDTDFRYGNIEIINRYNGVISRLYRGRKVYEVKIHLRGDVLVGRYLSETEAAVAYNKGADLIEEKIRRKMNENRNENVYCSKLHIDIQDVAYYDSRINDNIEDDGENPANIGTEGDKTKKYRNWRRNYIEDLPNKDYIRLYEHIRLAKSFRTFLDEL